MKKWMIMLGLAAAVGSYAQEFMPEQAEAYCWGWLPGYPQHYCTCRNTSQTFYFPLETQLTDTAWYETSFNDLKRGFSAYWFADCSVTFEIYAFCSSKTPTLTMEVNGNEMYEMDVTEINNQLEAAGDMAELLSQAINPRVKVYPNGGTGSVYCYPYDQGPVSTCGGTLPVIPGMTYVCDQAQEVYELQPQHMAANGEGFFRWRQKKNYEGEVWLTLDSCNGQEIGRATMSDSMRVYLPDTALMAAAATAGRSVFVHVTHDASYVGRIQYFNAIQWDVQTIDTTICHGKALELRDTVLRETTVYPNDTLWKENGTLALTTYNLTVEEPAPQYDTLRLKAAQLPYSYRNKLIPADGWGDYDFLITQPDRCDERYLLHVEHAVVRQETVVHDTVCEGKSVTYGGVTYTRDTVINDSAWADADTWVVSDISIHFTEPEPEYDTITVMPDEMTSRGYWYSELGVLVNYGDTVIVKTKRNACTRIIYLTVLGDVENPTSVEAVPYGARNGKYLKNGILYIRREGQDYDLLGRPLPQKREE